MRCSVRVSLPALLAGALLAVAAPAAAQASFGVERFAAANCSESHEACAGETKKVSTVLGPQTFWIPKEPNREEAKEQAYTQAAGHPAYGVTDFKVNTEGELPDQVPSEAAKRRFVTHVRTDAAPGVTTNPEAVPQCETKQFGEKEAISGTGFYAEPKCNTTGRESTVIGVNYVTVYAGEAFGDLSLKGTAYNLEQPERRASDFGVALELPLPFTKDALEKAFAEHPLMLPEPEKKATEKAFEEKQYFGHTMIEGGVEWGEESRGTGKGDYHDYYEIDVSTALPLIASRLVLKGDAGTTGLGGFITNPSNCAGPGPLTTDTVTLTSTEGEVKSKTYEAPIGPEGCKAENGLLIPPFAPEFALKPETRQQDQPDGITTELKLPQNPSPEGVDSSQLRTATVALPEGMTLNPSAAGEVTEACTPAQARIHSATFGVACPAKSQIGTDAVEVPTLPPRSLTGNMYLGGPEGGGPIGGPPYTIYLNAESKRYGVDVRLKGEVRPNETTGQLTVTFVESPELPLSDAILHFAGGALAPLANPLTCGAAKTETTLIPYIDTTLVPYAGSLETATPSSSFTVFANNAGGACPDPLPFSLSQSTESQPPGYAGAETSYTLNIRRNDGQQYLSRVKTVLPEGLAALMPSVLKCGEPQASEGECPEASRIGRVSVSAGAGASPYGFTGGVYLTGPYGGAPFGLSIVAPAIAGPFNLGDVVARGALNVEPYTAQIVATITLPAIVKGIPLRLRAISVEIDKQGFLVNPTSCGALATETTLSGFAAPGVTGTATQTLSTPFQVSGCSRLAFRPSLSAASGAKTSKANGASLEATLNLPAGDANLKSVLVQLPLRLPSRMTTLQQACPAAVFEAGPYSCPSGSFVGEVKAGTPTLGVQLRGPAMLVSHGGEAFPDLDLLLEGEGVRVILVGHTDIKNGITTTDFTTIPDLPVTSITVSLPAGGHSALAANGNVCAATLTMPTTIVSQSGVTFRQKTTVTVRNCPVRIVGRKVIGDSVYLTIQTYAPGRISASGAGLAAVSRRLKHAERTASLVVPLSPAGLLRGRPFRTRVRVGFLPAGKRAPRSSASVTVTFG